MPIRPPKVLIVAMLPLLLAGCATPFQGIRFRAQSPSIDDAFRKICLALTVDGFEITTVDPELHRVETLWRDAKEKELTEAEQKLAGGDVQVSVTVRLDSRGRGFEIYLTPSLRYREGVSWRQSVAAPNHPLREKWERTTTTLVEREVREED